MSLGTWPAFKFWHCLEGTPIAHSGEHIHPRPTQLNAVYQGARQDLYVTLQPATCPKHAEGLFGKGRVNTKQI